MDKFVKIAEDRFAWLVESPDDGGWYAEVVNGVGRDVFQTDVYPSANAALKVARERQAQREVLSR